MTTTNKETPHSTRTSQDVALSSLAGPEVPVEPIQGIEKEGEEDEFPTDWRKITMIMVALYMTMFLVALVSQVSSIPLCPNR